MTDSLDEKQKETVKDFNFMEPDLLNVMYNFIFIGLIISIIFFPLRFMNPKDETILTFYLIEFGLIFYFFISVWYVTIKQLIDIHKRMFNYMLYDKTISTFIITHTFKFIKKYPRLTGIITFTIVISWIIFKISLFV